MAAKKAEAYLPLTESTYYILISLVTPRHGYGIMQDVEALSEGTVRLGPGTLYGALSKLESEGLIAKTANEDSERRKYYVLTESGRNVARAEYERLAKLVRSSGAVLQKMQEGWQ